MKTTNNILTAIDRLVDAGSTPRAALTIIIKQFTPPADQLIVLQIQLGVN